MNIETINAIGIVLTNIAMLIQLLNLINQSKRIDIQSERIDLLLSSREPSGELCFFAKYNNDGSCDDIYINEDLKCRVGFTRVGIDEFKRIYESIKQN